MKIHKKIMAFTALTLALSTCGALQTAASAKLIDPFDHGVDITKTVLYGKQSEKSYLSSLKSSLEYVEVFEDFSLPVLTRSRTLKKCFQLRENEILIIPAGKTLTLTGGADIKGTIYIENGGKMEIKSFSTHLEGSIVCDGTLSVTYGTFTCFDGSLLYIGEKGTYTAIDCVEENGALNGRVEATPGAAYICFGTTDIPDPTLGAKPVAAVYCRSEFGGSQKTVSVITENLDELMPSRLGFNTSFIFGHGDFADYYNILFSGGSSILFTAEGTVENGWSDIGSAPVQAILAALQIYYDPSVAPDYIDPN